MTDWIAVASADHCAAAVEGGFVQHGHGRAAPVERLAPGDRLALDATRQRMDGGAPVQAFVALGDVADRAPWREGEDGPTRRVVEWRAELNHASVRPLLDDLDFVGDTRNWGLAFRRSLFRIAAAMAA